MQAIRVQPQAAEFVLLSFEGPDAYARAGGLGVRVSQLASALAQYDFHTHLFFVGDPTLPGFEQTEKGRLNLYRWCQWISHYHPNGVYDGEEDKLRDYTATIPEYIIENVIRPAILQDRNVIIMAEDWHTVDALIRLSDLLYAQGLRQFTVLIWNANNTMGFHRINWGRLNYISTLTTVSRYMKHLMRSLDVDPLVIPNGIPDCLLEPVSDEDVHQVKMMLGSDGRQLLMKVGRFDPAKCWDMAIDAAAQLKYSGQPVSFLCRGGIEPYGGELIERAWTSGLTVSHVDGRPTTWEQALDLIQSAPLADLYNLRFSLSQDMLRPFYSAADVVLANSKHEPFGLVGLEAMAAGGIVFTGPTGESYSNDGEGAIALDTTQPEEIVLHVHNLIKHPERAAQIRKTARQIASYFTWDNVLGTLLDKIMIAASTQRTRPMITTLDSPRFTVPEFLRVPYSVQPR